MNDDITCPIEAAALLARSPHAHCLAAAAAWCSPWRPMKQFVFGVPTP